MSLAGTVFVHTNDKQVLGAIVSAYSMKRNSSHADKFDVRIINARDFDFLRAREGQPFLREGGTRIWRNDDLQSFTPLRFMPPSLMHYSGRAVVVDPDIFAIGDIYELLTRDMQGKTILCKGRDNEKRYASSVMLLDCARLTHWNAERDFDELFERRRDYMDWISLKLEPEDSIGTFEEEWNHFDTLNERTKLLHNTKRRTQPWKTGLPVDFQPSELAKKAKSGLMKSIGLALNLQKEPKEKRYVAHPDENQTRFFFGLVKECLEKGLLTEAMLQEEMRLNHLRHDALQVIRSLDQQKVA